MKKHRSFLWSFVFVFSFLINVSAQDKVIQFPAGFEGHDAIVLYKNISDLLSQSRINPNNKEEIKNFLKGKKIYGDKTTDDYFAFTLKPVKYDLGKVSKSETIYRIETFPLLELDKKPPPKIEYTGGGFGAGRGIPIIKSPADLILFEREQISTEAFWTKRYLTIKTVIPSEAKSKEYIGYKSNCVRKSGDFLTRICDGSDFIVPSPQIHYGLAFVEKQKLPLVKVENNIISLENYNSEIYDSSGIVSWLQDELKTSDFSDPIFIVKLVSPYIKTDSFKTKDSIENNDHKAVRNLIYGNLIGVWVYEKNSGKIISKNGDKLEYSDKTAEVQDKNKDINNDNLLGRGILKTRQLQILSKPKPVYTKEARANNVIGVVKLRVTFLASGKIGSISPVNTLPYGLTEQAIKAARQITFLPYMVNGKAKSTIKTIAYSFVVY